MHSSFFHSNGSEGICVLLLVFSAGYYFDISLTISFDLYYDNSLADQNSETYHNCSQQVVQQVAMLLLV